MEAVPRLPMISFDLKVSPSQFPPEFAKLKQYIRDFYNEDPETYSTEIRNLETLRANAVHPAKDATGCAVLKKYFCQLHFLQSRFPIGRDDSVAIPFVWKDTYGGIVCTTSDIKYEMVNILYNIGALHSQLGAADDRTSPEGLKMACTHFQCAAWAFQHLKDSFPQLSGFDCLPIMQFMYQLSLAQAQECILEKSMTDNRKATINAKVAAQIVDYYNLAVNALIQPPVDDSSIIDVVGTKNFKSWKKYMKFKVTYYGCISLLYQGMQSEEQQKMGERIAYYQGALDKLNESIKLAKGLDQAEVVMDALIFTRDVVEGKRKAAKNENDFIYHEDTPDLDALPIIKGASLVKGTPFSVNDPEISGPDIFARLVPMKAHEISSLYSEEKAKLLRKVSSMIDSKDEEVVSFMSSLQLDYLRAHLDSPVLPQEVVDRCAALSAKPDAIPNLILAMDKLTDAYHDVNGMLKEVMELIKIEDISEKEYQEVMGSRPPSIVATDLTREGNKYMEAHKKAAESNETLHKAMTQHIENLRVLQQPLAEITSNLPNLDTLNVIDNPTVKEVTMLVEKVAEMRKQRAMLACQLRESICSDDITAQLVTRTDEKKEEIFEKEMQKHNKYISLIEQNLVAQDKILPALTDAYAKYAPVRKSVTEIMRQKEMMLSALISSYDAYEDLITKSNKGLEFYRKLETNLTKLLQRVKGTCKVQQEERDTILSQNNKKIEQGNSSDSSSSSTPGLKLKDYLQSRKAGQAGGSYYPGQVSGSGTESQQIWPPSVRPTPLGSEGNSTNPVDYTGYNPNSAYATAAYSTYPQTSYDADYSQNYMAAYGGYQDPVSVDLQNLQYPNLTTSGSTTSLGMSSPSPNQYTTNMQSNYAQQQQQQVAPSYGQYDTGSSMRTPYMQNPSVQDTQQMSTPQHVNPYQQYTQVQTGVQSYQTPLPQQNMTPVSQTQAQTDFSTQTVPSNYVSTAAMDTGVSSYSSAQPANSYQHNGIYNQYSGSYQVPTQQQWPQQNYAYSSPQGAYGNQTTAGQGYSAPLPQISNSYGTEAINNYSGYNTMDTNAAPNINIGQVAPVPQQTYNQSMNNQEQIPYSKPPDPLGDHDYFRKSNPSTSMSTQDYSHYYQDYTNTYPNMQFQTTPGTDTSHYSNASGQATYETNSASMTPEGLTYASQYVASTVPSQQYQNYYTTPYGYPYPLVTEEQPKTEPPPQPLNQSNSMTYIQSNSSNSGMMMTYSQQPNGTTPTQPAPPEKKHSSNMDLLTGLDFTMTETPPLQPQQSVQNDAKLLEQSQEKMAKLTIEPKSSPSSTQMPVNDIDTHKQV